MARGGFKFQISNFKVRGSKFEVQGSKFSNAFQRFVWSSGMGVAVFTRQRSGAANGGVREPLGARWSVPALLALGLVGRDRKPRSLRSGLFTAGPPALRKYFATLET